MSQRIVLLFLLFLFVISNAVYVSTAEAVCISCIRVTVGAPWTVGSPGNWPSTLYPDSPTPTFNTGTAVRGYNASGNTIRLAGADTTSLVPIFSPFALSKGSTGNFDYDGAWIMAVRKEGTLVKAWYHAEGPTSSQCPDGQHTVAYATSSDNGVSFTKPNYPNNQIVTPDYSCTASTPGIAGHTVIVNGSYRYLYFNDTKGGIWQTAVARSLTSTAGGSGDWFKYYNGSWSQPGLGGKATQLGLFGYSASKYLGSPKQVVLLRADHWSNGLRMYFGNIPLGSFTILGDPLIPLDDVQFSPRPAPTELVAYASAAAQNGGNEWSTYFILHYLYEQPNEGPNKRYFLRRNVWVTEAATPQTPQVRIQFRRYYNGTNDHWATTTYTPGYASQKELGWLMTKLHPTKPTNQIDDCWWDGSGWPGHPNHIATGNGTCGTAQKLRTLGWVYTNSKSNTIPLYRCYDSGKKDHFVSDQSNCEGLGQLEWLLGYAIAS